MTREQMEAQQREIRARLEELRAEAETRSLTQDESKEIDSLMAQFDLLGRMMRMQFGVTATESGDGARHDAQHQHRAGVPDRNQAVRSEALRAIEAHTGVMSAAAADQLERFVEEDVASARGGIDSRYIAAVADPNYRSAFGKMLGDAATAHLRFTPAEHEAVGRVNEAMAERAMSEGTTTAGGFAVPFQLDPTIILNSTGSLNPVRQFAQVSTVTSNVWKGITSAGVTASFDAETEEVSDDTPTLAQPEIDVEMARAFVPFSIELGQDWGGFQPEMASMLVDAKDTLEASKFLDGAGHGSNEPDGILTGATITVPTAGTATFAIADVYSLLEAIPPRFQANASVLAHSVVFDKAYRFAGGGSTEPPVLPTREGPLLGRPKGEWSAMSSATTTSNSKIMIAGDIRAGFRIADRLGMQVELVQHLFGASGRPTGQRGVFAYWRTSSKTIVPQAIRVLKVL